MVGCGAFCPLPWARGAAWSPLRGVPAALGTACPPPLSPRSHVHVQALHPGPGGAAAPRPPGHEETWVWSRAVEWLRGQGTAGGEHRGGRSQVRPGLARRGGNWGTGWAVEALDHLWWAAGGVIVAWPIGNTLVTSVLPTSAGVSRLWAEKITCSTGDGGSATRTKKRHCSPLPVTCRSVTVIQSASNGKVPSVLPPTSRL